MADHTACDFIAIEGEIVEIFTREGRRLVRIVVTPQIVCEVAADEFGDAHLGDHVVVKGRVTIEQVTVVPPGDVV